MLQKLPHWQSLQSDSPSTDSLSELSQVHLSSIECVCLFVDNFLNNEIMTKTDFNELTRINELTVKTTSNYMSCIRKTACFPVNYACEICPHSLQEGRNVSGGAARLQMGIVCSL